jgi:hypothetical protein
MNRYREPTGTGPQVAAGWQLAHLAPPSGLFGANGMQFGAGPDSGATVPVCRARGRE